MDPNETLNRLRDLLGEHDKPMSADEITEASELFTTFDEWLSRGGFLPTEWSANIGVTTGRIFRPNQPRKRGNEAAWL